MNNPDQSIDIRDEYRDLCACEIQIGDLKGWYAFYHSLPQQGGLNLSFEFETVSAEVALGVDKSTDSIHDRTLFSMSYEVCEWLCFNIDRGFDQFRMISPLHRLCVDKDIDLHLRFEEVLVEDDIIPALSKFANDIEKLQQRVAQLSCIGGSSGERDPSADELLNNLNSLGQILWSTHRLMLTQRLLTVVEHEDGIVSEVVLGHLWDQLQNASKAIERIGLAYGEFLAVVGGQIAAIIDSDESMNYHQKEVVTAALAEPIIDGQAPVQVSNHLLRAALTRFTERILEKFVGD